MPSDITATVIEHRHFNFTICRPSAPHRIPPLGRITGRISPPRQFERFCLLCAIRIICELVAAARPLTLDRAKEDIAPIMTLYSYFRHFASATAVSF